MTPLQLQSAWNDIRSRPQIIPSKREQASALFAYYLAKRDRPSPPLKAAGRRHIKGRAKHVGAVLKNSSIRSEVHIETVFNQRKFGA